MNLERYLTGRPVTLNQMLDAREQRAQIQARLLKAYPMTLISFTLNMAGPVKVFPLSEWAFEEGVRRIVYLLRACGIRLVHREELRSHTGNECFLSVSAPALEVKGRLVILEQEDALGRLFDLDVLDSRGEKISRSSVGLPERTCLLCGNPVFLCSRNRAHSLEAVQQKTCQLLEEAYRASRSRKLSDLAVEALLREVQTTPKPGLVDMANTGAHRDMDFRTFQASALALHPYFAEFAAYGQELPAEALLPGLREIGIRAERAMLAATGGVNTHKGMIFSMGILLSALSRWNGWEGRPTLEALRDMCKKIAAPLAADFAGLSGHTHGEALYLKCGVRGARGEALAGFPALFETALPVLDALTWHHGGWNQAGVVTLLHIMAAVEDSNMISRSSPERAASIRQEIARTLAQTDDIGRLTAYASELDGVLIKENISPGGSADILALAYFLKSLRDEDLLD